jgi:hypothetical protein
MSGDKMRQTGKWQAGSTTHDEETWGYLLGMEYEAIKSTQTQYVAIVILSRIQRKVFLDWKVKLFSYCPAVSMNKMTGNPKGHSR